MSLKRYGFTDNTYMDGKNYNVVVSSQDKIIEVFDGNVLKASVSLELNGNTLSLIGKNNAILSEVNLPKSRTIKDIYFDSERKEMVFVFEMEDDSVQEYCVNISDLVMIYEGSDGIEVVGNKISLKIDENSKQYLNTTEGGLSFNADSLDSTYATDSELAESVKDMATKTWVLEQGFVTESPDVSGFATKEELGNESSIRQDADNVLHDWIEKEIEEREKADIALNKWIGKEVEERTNAVYNLTTMMNDKIGMTDISNPANPDRKAIVLNNHDTILGKTTDGRTANIAMLSKWDNVDIGSSAVSLNLNGKDERPTYNDTKKIAFLSDIAGGSCADCAPKGHRHDDLYAPINHTHDEYATDNDLAEEISARETADEELNDRIDSIDSSLSNYAPIGHTHDDKVSWDNIGENRKSITLPNNDMLLGTNTNGSTANIAMISKWNVVDLGSSSLPINLNTPKDVRPTIQEAGQSGEEAHKMAYLSDLEAISDTLSGYSKVDHVHNEYASVESLNDEIQARVNGDMNLSDELTYVRSSLNDYSLTSHTHSEYASSFELNNEIADRESADNALSTSIENAKSELNQRIDEVSERIGNAVEFSDISSSGNPDRKAILLGNNDMLLGEVKGGGSANIAMINKWNIVDLGSSSLPINLNTPKNVRPTVQEAGQNGAEAHKVAYLSDVESVSESLADYSKVGHKHDEYALQDALSKESENRVNDVNRIDAELAKKVSLIEFPTEEYPDRKAISLKNNDMLVGERRNGAYAGIARVTKWDVVDLGTPVLKININTPQNERPTIKEAGQSSEEANKMAYLTDVEAVNNSLSGYSKVGHTHDEYLSSSGLNDEIAERKEEDVKLNERIDSVDAKFNDYSLTSHTHAEYALSSDLSKVSEELDSKIGFTNIPSQNEPNRKAIVLENNDMLLGKKVDGGSANIAMINKWGIVDLGSSSLPINLNTPKDVRPTVQEAGQSGEEANKVAYLSDVEAVSSSLSGYSLVGHNHDSEYAKVSHTHHEYALNEALDREVSDRESEIQKVIDSIVSEVSIREAKDTDLENSLSSEIADRIESNSALQTELDNISNSLSGYAISNHTHAEIEENAANLETEIANREKADEDILKEVSEKVEWTKIPNSEHPNRKAITLSNHDILLGTNTSGSTANIAMISKWNIVDLGSSSLPINLNTPKDVRPTVQEAGQSGEEAHKIAYLSDLDNKVELIDVSDESNPNRKAVVLNNHDCILGNTTDSGSVNIAMVSKWDKVDLGSTSVEINLNGSSERPTYNDDKEIALMSDLESKVSFETLQDGRKFITMGNGDMLLGTNTSGSTANIAMINRWDVVDLGTSSLPINFNTPKGVRPTVQEQGQSGEEANKIAYLSDILNLATDLNIALGKIKTLEDKVESLSKTNVESITINEATAELNDNTADYIIQGDMTKSLNITGKSVKVDGLQVSNDARTTIASKDVTLNNVALSGDFPKSVRNSVISINDSEHLVINGLDNKSDKNYNLVEIGLSKNHSVPKTVLIENCNFGNSNNNSILIFGQEDGAVININNCTFGNVSNAIRLSNKTNTRCTVNITNCKFEKFDDNLEYNGIMVLEDYTSTTAEMAYENNLYGDGKITVNIINCVGPNGKITMPIDISEVCGSKDEKQLLYVYYDKVGFIDYDSSKYPVLNII